MWELDRKEAECQRIDAFELWCWRRLLRVPWTARRSNQSFLKEISPEYSLEGLMLKLKLQYFGYLMRRTDSLEKTLMLGKIEDRRRRGRQRMRWFDGITDLMDMSLSKLRSLACSDHGVAKSWTQLRDKTDWISPILLVDPLSKPDSQRRINFGFKTIHHCGDSGSLIPAEIMAPANWETLT